MAKQATPRPSAAGQGSGDGYKPEYADMVADFMANGFSLTAFAGSIRAARSSVYNWRKTHPDFDQACQVGLAARVTTLESGLLGSKTSAETTAHIFALKNACPDEWREKVQNELTGANGGPIEIIRRVVDPKQP